MWVIAASPIAELKWCQKRFRTVLPAWGPGPPSTGATTTAEKLRGNLICGRCRYPSFSSSVHYPWGGSVAEWLACWTQAQKGLVQIAAATLSDNNLRQTVHTHCASVHKAAKLVAALLRVAGVTAGLVKSNGILPPGL